METTSNTEPINSVAEMHTLILNVMDKYTFIDQYLAQPDIITGKPMSTFIKLMSTILYLRQRVGFLVEPTESFYSYIEHNDYTNFQNIDKVDIYKILVSFVTFACGYINSSVDEVEDRDKIINMIRKYYYKNLEFPYELN